MWLILKICFMSSVFVRSWSVVCGCICSSCHIIAVDIYICSIRHCGTLLTWPDRRGATSVLPVGGWTSVVTGVFHRICIAAVGLWAAACLGVAGATDGCTAGAVGACCSCTAFEVDGVVTGCPATSTFGCVSGFTASGWCSRMWSCAHLYSAPPMTLTMYDWLHVQQWQEATMSCHCWLQKKVVLHRVGLSCGNLYGHC